LKNNIQKPPSHTVANMYNTSYYKYK